MMYPVFFSLWIAMWAVLLLTLPFHLLLHGIVAYRIAQAEGWGAVLKRGRYFREIRQSPTLTRMMIGWLVIAFLEVCALVGLSGLVAFTAQSYDPDAMQVVSVPQSGDVLVASGSTIWRIDDSFRAEPSLVLPSDQYVRFADGSSDAEVLYVSAGTPARTDIFQFDIAAEQIVVVYSNDSAFVRAVSPDGSHALIEYFVSQHPDESALCILEASTSQCRDIDASPDTRLFDVYWLPSIGPIGFLSTLSGTQLMELDVDGGGWTPLAQFDIAAVGQMPRQDRLIIHDEISGIVLYDVETGDVERIPNIYSNVHPLSLIASPDARYLIMQEAQIVTIYDLETQRALISLGSVVDAMWLPDSAHIVVARYPQDQVQRRVNWFVDLLHPVQVVQVNVRYTAIEKIEIQSGAAVASVQFPDVPTLLMVYQ